MTAGAIRTTLADRDISRERLTLTRTFEELRQFGYEGGYGAALCPRLNAVRVFVWAYPRRLVRDWFRSRV
jgi:hypothetical protein